MNPETLTQCLRFAKAFYRLFSSKSFLIWLAGSWIIYYVMISIWSMESFGNFVTGLKNSFHIRIPFLLFLVSGYLNIIRSSLTRVKKGGGIQFIAWLLLPLGFMLFLSGFYISVTTRQFEWVTVAKEHILKPSFSTESYLIDDIKPGIREGLSDKYSGNVIFAYEPKVVVRDKSEHRYEAGAFPARRIDGFYAHILNFGLAPGIVIDDGGVNTGEWYLPLKIISPGNSDYFNILNYPYRVLLTLEPEMVNGDERQLSGQFNLKKPLYRLKVFNGEKVIKEAESRDGIQFDNLTISFLEPTFWAMIEVVKDLGVPVILSGLLLMILGIPACFFRILFQSKM